MISGDAVDPRFTIYPDVNDLELNYGDSYQEDLVVFIPKTTPEMKFDLYFLADTTLYMDPFLDEIKRALDLIFSRLMNRGFDIAFGVGNYKDFTDSAFAFLHQLKPTTNTSDIGRAINDWVANGGGNEDIPEAQLYALNEIAGNPGGIGWRADAKRVILWFGDAPGHEPICSALSGHSYDITVPSLIEVLRRQDIMILAISLNNDADERGVFGLNRDPNLPIFHSPISTPYEVCEHTVGPSPMQAARLTAATGGVAFQGVRQSDIVRAIVDIVSFAVVGIREMRLDRTDEAATVFANGIFRTETADLSVHGAEFIFKVDFLGQKRCLREAQVFEGTIDVVVDGNVKASKVLKITVPFCMSVEPNVNNLELKYGATVQEDIEVSIPTRSHETKYDLYFLADTTNSMTPYLNSVSSGVNQIVSTLSGRGLDVAFGVGNYKDFADDEIPFLHQLGPTKEITAIQRATNSWTAYSNNQDAPEAQLFALNHIAENPEEIGWRTDAKRIIVWFGDAPGHEPICARLSGLSHDITVASLIQVLNSQKIVVLAISLLDPRYPGSGGLDVWTNLLITENVGHYKLCGPLGLATRQQATKIAEATGGRVLHEISADQIVDAITQIVSSTVVGIHEVSLIAAGNASRFVKSISKIDIHDLSMHGVRFKFKVEFQGQELGTHEEQRFTGTIDAVVDGEVKASKTLNVTVPPAKLVKISLAPYATVVQFSVSVPEDQIFVFAMNSNGEMSVCSHTGDPHLAKSWSWTHLAAPINTRIQGYQWQTVFGIAAYENSRGEKGFVHAFVVCKDRHLYETTYDGSEWTKWVDHDSPANSYGGLAYANPVPAAFIYRGFSGYGNDRLSSLVDSIITFIEGTDGELHQYDQRLTRPTPGIRGWQPLPARPSGVNIASLVGQRTRYDGNASLYLIGSNGHLYEIHSRLRWEAAGWTWVDLGQPNDNVGLRWLQRPSVGVGVCVMGVDGHLWKMTSIGSTSWHDLSTPTGVSIVSAVSVVGYDHMQYAFVCGSDGHLYVHIEELRLEGRNWHIVGTKWKDLGHPVNTTLKFDPTAVSCTYPERDPIYVFAHGADGYLHMCHMDSGITSWEWLDLKKETYYS